MPELIKETVMVFERFKHGGMEYEGATACLSDRWVRRVVAKNPEWFRMEYAPEPVDLEWLDALEDDSEERYRAILRAREAEKAGRERALRAELAEQNASQPDLERRYEKQEIEKRKQGDRAREERGREKVERAVELRGGYHF